MSVISVEHLTKDYKNGRGVFDVNFSIEQGEVFGIVGTNGSGKTTTIRHIMGFLKPEKGKVCVLGLDSWENSSEIMKNIGYVPGEIAFPDLKDGVTFLKTQAELLELTDMTRANEIISRLQLDPSANLKRMSKGMKQKTALVVGFMADKDIIILDEPTTGLDPLMREEFLEIIKEEKAKGKTILMSSQSFDELEAVCDRVGMIYNGHLIDVVDIATIGKPDKNTYKIEFLSEGDYKKFLKLGYNVIRTQENFNQVTVEISKSEISKMFESLSELKIKFISQIKYNLERHFKEVLSRVKEDKNV